MTTENNTTTKKVTKIVENKELNNSGFEKLKSKDPQKKRHFKMFSAFTILLLIIAFLVLLS
jgi:hypothetical protein